MAMVEEGIWELLVGLGYCGVRMGMCRSALTMTWQWLVSNPYLPGRSGLTWVQKILPH